MNPQVKQIVKILSVLTGTLVLLFAWDYIRGMLSENFLDQLDGVIVYVIVVGAFVVGAIAVVFVFSNLFYEVYTETILQRAEKIRAIAVDQKEEYLYVAASCYQSGDESGPGFYIDRDYLFELATGKKFLYQAKKNSGNEKAINFFNTILKKERPLHFTFNETVNYSFSTKSQNIKITAFRTKIDFGFQIICRSKETGTIGWKKKI